MCFLFCYFLFGETVSKFISSGLRCVFSSFSCKNVTYIQHNVQVYASIFSAASEITNTKIQISAFM